LLRRKRRNHHHWLTSQVRHMEFLLDW
jgi:hypothetical protein